MGPPAAALVAHATYRYLRLMMITLPTLLLVATALAFFWLGTIETSEPRGGRRQPRLAGGDGRAGQLHGCRPA